MTPRGPSLCDRVAEWVGELASVLLAIGREALSLPPYGNTGVIDGRPLTVNRHKSSTYGANRDRNC